MKINRTSPNMDMNTMKKLLDKDTKRVSDVKDLSFNVQAYAIFERNDMRVLSFIDTNGDVYATNSATFIEDFETIIEISEMFNSPLPLITVKEKTSNRGRPFLRCV